MGFFSWKTSDTKRSIPNIYSNKKTFPVYVLVPKEFQKEYGKYIEKKEYDGYGIFGGHDIYALVAKWNEPDECKKDGEWLPEDDIRGIGIDIACYDVQNEKLKYPIKIVENKDLEYEEVTPSDSCPDQGYFYDKDDIEIKITIDLNDKRVFISEENSSVCDYEFNNTKEISESFEDYLYNYVEKRINQNEEEEEENEQ